MVLNRVQRQPKPTSLREEDPTALLWRQAKVRVLQGARLLRWLREPAAFGAPRISTAAADFPHLLYDRRVQISRSDPGAHPLFEAGKRTNLALAAPAFDGLVLSPEQPLSFWRTLGRVRAALGYRPGMELRGGCIVPALGGGLCLLSNALYVMAVELGFTILERHGHTLEAVPPAPEEMWGLDATVFWPYVDLRFAPGAAGAWLRVRVEGGELRLSVYSDRPLGLRVLLQAEDGEIEDTAEGRVRKNRIRRRIFAVATGALVSEDIVAHNRKRLLHQAEQRRNCLTCEESACHARPQLLKLTRSSR